MESVFSDDKNYLFVKNVLHVSAYTTVAKYSFMKVLRKNSRFVNVKL